MASVIPVNDETYERAQKVKENYRITYNELLTALLDEVNTDEINLDKIGDDVKATGRTKATRKDDEVKELIKQNEDDKEVIDEAMRFVKMMYDEGEMLESYPHTVAASAVYTAGVLKNKKQKQKHIAEKYECSKPTIRKKYHTMLDLGDYTY